MLKLEVHKVIREAMYVKGNTEARSSNHFCCGKSNKCYMFWECNLKTHAPYCIVIRDLYGSAISVHITAQTTWFYGERFWTQSVRF